MLVVERKGPGPAAELDDACVELIQALALLRAIDEGELFGATPTDGAARKRHEAGATLLAMVEPRLERVLLRLRLAE